MPAASVQPLPSLTPQATATPAASLLPLPEGISGIPGANESGVELAPETPPDEMQIGVARDFLLGHCGLISPIDIDGSLWDPVGGHDGSGSPLTDDQLGDLINATSTIVVLTDEDTMEMQTEHGAVITLIRHDGPRRYLMCA